FAAFRGFTSRCNLLRETGHGPLLAVVVAGRSDSGAAFDLGFWRASLGFERVFPASAVTLNQMSLRMLRLDTAAFFKTRQPCRAAIAIGGRQWNFSARSAKS